MPKGVSDRDKDAALHILKPDANSHSKDDNKNSIYNNKVGG